MPWIYYEIRKGTARSGRAYPRQLTEEEIDRTVFMLSQSQGEPVTIKFIGGGSDPIPKWWKGNPQNWQIMEKV